MLIILFLFAFICSVIRCLAGFMVSSFSHQHHRQQRDVSPKPADDNILLVQSIQITDKFGFNQDAANSLNSTENREKIYTSLNDETFTCLNGYGK